MAADVRWLEPARACSTCRGDRPSTRTLKPIVRAIWISTPSLRFGT
ncbi:hypothetical protein CNE_BB2p02520 (plasmid) [Cupriavidus necator N-1]|uniref:Uncharacterized protein n=1 Tax=Cupriavidus necator (strain ATCC 43291 / DSM 13513 / CCUG 52238 / LMG 8453 / N-1) TaxID=1042878 RepID=F8GYW5_CUPNN|nr:hypothetical protein CNE_BB2p02520 [Cupriavidus necator N-1]